MTLSRGRRTRKGTCMSCISKLQVRTFVNEGQHFCHLQYRNAGTQFVLFAVQLALHADNIIFSLELRSGVSGVSHWTSLDRGT
jgi:hypothetical protein